MSSADTAKCSFYCYAKFHLAECCYAECSNAKCLYAECRYVKCHGASTVDWEALEYLLWIIVYLLIPL